MFSFSHCPNYLSPLLPFFFTSMKPSMKTKPDQTKPEGTQFCTLYYVLILAFRIFTANNSILWGVKIGADPLLQHNSLLWVPCAMFHIPCSMCEPYFSTTVHSAAPIVLHMAAVRRLISRFWDTRPHLILFSGCRQTFLNPKCCG